MISTLNCIFIIFEKFKEKLVTKVKKDKNEKNNPVPRKNLIFFHNAPLKKNRGWGEFPH